METQNVGRVPGHSAGVASPDPDDFAQRVAQAESGNRMIQNQTGSNAFGTFQFMPNTWADLVRRHPDLLTSDGIRDERQQVIGERLFREQNRQVLSGRLGREQFQDWEMYSAHMLGAGGASHFLREIERDPEMKVSDLISLWSRNPDSVMDVNPQFSHSNGESKSLSELRDFFMGRVGTDRIDQNRRVEEARGQAIDAGDMRSPAVMSGANRRELASLQARLDEDSASLWEVARASVDNHWIVNNALDMLGRDRHDPDPGFNWLENMELANQVPEDQRHILHDAVSLEHAQSIIQRYNEAVERRELIQSRGGVGLATEIVTAMFDPAAVGISIVTGGLGAKFAYGQKMGRLGQILAGGASAGLTNAGIEGFLAQNDPLRTNMDIIIGGLAGLALGGAAGGMLSTPAQRQLDNIRNGSLNATVRGLRRDLETPDPYSAGAALNPIATTLARASDEEAMTRWRTDRAVRQDVTGDRLTMYSAAARSKHDGIATAMRLLGDNPSGVYTQGQNVGNASGWQQMNFLTGFGRANRILGTRFNEYLKETGKRQGLTGRTYEEFLNDVGRTVRDPNASPIKAVTQAADDFREQVFYAALKRLKDSGAEAFENVKFDPNYIPRIYSMEKLRNVEMRLGGRLGLNQFVAQSIISASRKAGKTIDGDQAVTIAEGFIRNLLEGRAGLGGRVAASSADRLKTLKGDLTDALGQSMDAEELDGIVDGLVRIADGKPPRAQQRTILDETFVDPRTGIRFDELLENNIEALSQEYLRSTSGIYGLAKVGLTKDGDWDALIDQIKRTADKYDVKPKDLQGELDVLDTVKRMITNQQLDSSMGPKARLWTQRMLGFNFTRVMGQVGLAQIPEMGNIIGHHGFRALWQQMPVLGSIVKKGKNGRLSNQFLDEIETNFGLGLDGQTMSIYGRYDDGVPQGMMDGRIDRGIRRSNRIVANTSLMNPINVGLERMAAASMLQRLANLSMGKGGRMSERRLRSIGLEGDRGAKVFAEMKDKASFKEGTLTGRSLAQLNIDQWNPEARDILLNAVFSSTRRVIQKNSPADMARFMTSDFARIMFQFMSFAQVAFAKQLLHNIRMKDGASAMTFLATTLGGFMSYVAVTESKAIGRADPKAYRERAYEISKLAGGTFYRTSWSSLMPMGLSPLIYAAGGSDPFSMARTTALSTTLSSPTTDVILGARNSLAKLGAAGAQNDQELDGSDVRQLLRLLPFQNAFVISQVLDKLTGIE